MSLSERLSAGWRIAVNSLKVLRENKQLIIFPVLSGISMTLIVGSFVVAVLSSYGWHVNDIETPTVVSYAIMLVFYVVNYFVVVFFNTALVHCATLYFKGEEVSINKGIRFSISRIGAIFSWALFAGTVGAALRILQENLGTIGKIITGLVGIVWGVTTFFVVPLIANENLGPIDAFKRSALLMKEKWGQTVGAGFSFGLIQIGFILLAIIPAALIGVFVHPVAGIILGVLTVLAISAIFSAAKTIFTTAIYLNVTGDPVELFNQQLVDSLFVEKKKFFN